MSLSWNIPESVVDYCLGPVTVICDFVEYLQAYWSLESSGVTDFMGVVVHLQLLKNYNKI